MEYSYTVEETPPDDVPSVEHDIRRAKKFLQKHSTESGDSLYDHLTELLAKLLAEQPRNAVDIFEEYSRKLKKERFKTKTDHLRDLYIPPVQYDDAKKLIKLFQSARQIEGEQERMEDEEEDDKKKKYPDMLDFLFYFEQTSVGLPRHEMVLLNLSIRKLASAVPLENIRFWGKILGKPKNYYVVEAEFQADELARRLEQEKAEVQTEREKEEFETEAAAKFTEKEAEVIKTETEAVDETVGTTEIPQENTGAGKPLELVFPPLPVNPWRPLPEVPAERIGSGLNKKVYFVCNTPGLDEWIELPAITPQQIVIARQIVRYCTGNLETPIHSFPPFPGVEKNYLRAQIARISATTHVSPIGFFTLGGEGEDEEIEEEREEAVYAEGELTENMHYEPLPIKDLVDPTMSNWCHHSPYILKQGRIMWWNPEKEEDIVDEELGEEDEVERDEVKTIEKEIGPPLLTPLSEDATVDSVIPWTVRQSSYLQPDNAVALVRSNVWPGAFAFAVGQRFANVYIGWGHKYNAYNYSPPNMPPVQNQYKIGPEIMEIRDPTVDEEQAWRMARSLPAEEEEVLDEEVEDEDEDEDEEDEEDEEDDE